MLSTYHFRILIFISLLTITISMYFQYQRQRIAFGGISSLGNKGKDTITFNIFLNLIFNCLKYSRKYQKFQIYQKCDACTTHTWPAKFLIECTDSPLGSRLIGHVCLASCEQFIDKRFLFSSFTLDLYMTYKCHIYVCTCIVCVYLYVHRCLTQSGIKFRSVCFRLD